MIKFSNFQVILLLFFLLIAGCDDGVTTPLADNGDYLPDSGDDDTGADLDTTPPGDVAELAVTVGSTMVTLSWVPPSDSDLDKIEVWYGESGLSATQYTGTVGMNSAIISGLTNGIIYEFTVKAVDASSNNSTGESITAQPNRSVEFAKLTADDGANGDSFGRVVSISGNLAIVGASNNDSAASNAGSVYIFGRDQGGSEEWGLVKQLFALDAHSSDFFGGAVCISGTYAVVGATGCDVRDPSDDSVITSSTGAVYLFGRDQGGTGNWGLIKKLTAADSLANDLYGSSVHISGDTLVIGARYENTLGDNAGAAFVYDRNKGGTDNWGLVKKLTAGDGAASDSFGTSASIDGDIIVVGAPMADGQNAGGTTVADAGAAYVFYRDQGGAGNWGQVAKLMDTVSPLFDNSFGTAVDISGTTIIVGDFLLDGSGEAADIGGAFLFDKDHEGTDNWGKTALLTPTTQIIHEYFGRSVGIDGNRIIVGSYGNSTDASRSGAVYLYDSGDLSDATKVKVTDAQSDDWLGFSVGVSGNTMIAGSYQGNLSTDGPGAAYILKY